MIDKSAALEKIRTLVGDNNVVTGGTALDAYNTDWRGLFKGSCRFAVRPGSTEEVAEIVKIAGSAKLPIVPLSCNTGLVGGGITEDGIILSTERMNKILAVDPVNSTMTVEAGCILADVQKAADDANRLFPLSLAAEGSCRIGGNLSTNAGGVNVLRYGNARDLVLGLEVVLPDGRVWNGLRGLRKDNTGYEMKHLFMGAEGTLGIITGAVLKLFPKARQTETALIALSGSENVVKLFERAGTVIGDSLNAFEYMNRLSIACTFGIGTIRDPFALPHQAYVLMEVTSPRDGRHLRDALEEFLGAALEAGEIEDAVIAESGQQRDELWKIRETIPEAQSHFGGSIKNDVSIPVSRVHEFLTRADAAVANVVEGIRPCSFGHIGDGNIHYNLTQPEGADRAAFMAEWHKVTDLVNDIVHDLDGSFSAEHGIGKLKRAELVRYRSGVEIELMRTLKATLDPLGIMNPGKVL
ncbi:MAG: FAD-binding oxidoreductase [Proteobacteria bacterium]|nr:FAD-binding oxidoreductase [Pseudomonadota bacterium]